LIAINAVAEAGGYPSSIGRRMAMRKRVLVVEDEVLLAWLARATLEQAGYGVVSTTASRSLAVAAALAHQPDLVLMDVELAADPARHEDGDGVAAACDIYDATGIRCIFTGDLDAAARARAAEARPLGWLAKPYGGRALLAVLRDARSALDGCTNPLREPLSCGREKNQ
jgi:CheY-like chemotaxis protein